MATTADALAGASPLSDHLSGATRASVLDRWIYVFTAVGFIAIALAGFLPDSAHKMELIKLGSRAPFPLVLHLHALLMGSFLLLLLAQTTLAAMGRTDLHMQLGVVGMVLAPALVVVGFVLSPTMYHLALHTAQAAQGPARAALMRGVRGAENTMLLQFRAGILFPLLLFIGLRARTADPGLHKRLMILAVAPALGAGFARISWLPTTLPGSPLSQDIDVLVAIAPMLVWDLTRNRRVHRAYWIALAATLPLALAVNGLWDTPWWHAAAKWMMRV
ncbi:MAG TPA: hypothetical protein VHV27_08335 [Phenylobacterium sp.]|nr:hypothetical protein [Phenylobacterium sp.]